MMKKILSILLVVCMIVSMVPFQATAAEQYSITVYCYDSTGYVDGVTVVSSAAAGETVQIIPKAGYSINSADASAADYNSLFYVNADSGSFTMPAEDVILYVEVKPLSNQPHKIERHWDYNQESYKGTYSFTPESAVYGTTITVTAVPEEGYKPVYMTYWINDGRDSGGVDFAFTGNVGTFTMPDADVIVKVYFEEGEADPIPTPTETDPPTPDETDPPAAQKYTITVNCINVNTGTSIIEECVTAPTEAAAEEDVTITIRDGFEMVSMYWEGESGNREYYTEPTFQMPAEDVTVTVYLEYVTPSTPPADQKYKIDVVCYDVETNQVITEDCVTVASEAAADELVPITVAEGFGLMHIFVTGDNGYRQQFWQAPFKMPAQDVTLELYLMRRTPVAPTTYTVTVADGIQNGTVTADKTTAAAGETVTVTATPAEGYELDAITYVDGNNNTVTVTDGQFAMPASDVTVTAVFREVPEAYKVTLAPVTGANVAISHTSAYEDQEITVTVAPKSGHELDTITAKDADGNPVTVTVTGNVGKFTMPAADVTVTVTMKAKAGHTDCTLAADNWTVLTKTSGTLEAGNYYLTSDLTLTGRLTISGTVNLCLNGSDINANGLSAAISVPEGATLNLADCCGGGKITGARQNNESPFGSVLSVYGGTVNMHGGTITGNSATRYGNIYVLEGTFNMYGGSVTGNTLSGSYNYGGAGFYIRDGGTFNMHGGVISGNTASGSAYGGGVYVANSVGTFYGGTISGNSAVRGGGIYCNSSATVNVVGGTITGNSASEYGNGIFYSCNEGSSAVLKIGGAPNIVDDIYLQNKDGVDKYPFITSAIRNGLILTLSNPVENRVIAAGKDYILTTADLARITLRTGATPYYPVLDTENNRIILSRTDPGYTASYYITYDANGGSGTLEDNTGYALNAEATAKANTFTKPSSNFLGWNTKADGSGTTYAAGSKITVTGNITLYAMWETRSYEVTVADTENGTASVSASFADAGDEITVTATPAEGYMVDTITVKTALNTNVAVANGKFTMPSSDVTVTVTFKVIPAATYTVTVAPTTNGTATVDKSTAAAGETVTVTATPAEGYALDTITAVDASGATVTVTDGKFIMPAANVTVTATFKEVPATTYTVTVAPTTNGTATVNKSTAAAGETVTVTATPAEGYALDAITAVDASGAAVTVTNGSFTMPAANVTVTATFRKINNEVTKEQEGEGETIIKGTDGTITDGSKLEPGSTFEVETNPDLGYHVSQIIVTDEEGNVITPVDGIYTMPDSDVRIKVIYDPNTYNITPKVQTGGSVDVNLTADYKETVTFHVDVADGYSLKRVLVVPIEGTTMKNQGASTSGTDLSFEPNDLGNNNFQFTMPYYDVDLVVTFAKNDYEITVTTDKSTVTIDGVNAANGSKTSVEAGSEPVIVIKANTGYLIKKVTLNGVDITKDLFNGKITLDPVTEDLKLVVDTTKIASNPYTGDDFRIHAWIFVMVSSAACAAYLTFRRRFVK